MNILPIAPNAIAKRMSEPNRKERKPTASNSALPNPFVSFALVGISPSANSTSLYSIDLRVLSECTPNVSTKFYKLKMFTLN